MRLISKMPSASSEIKNIQCCLGLDAFKKHKKIGNLVEKR